MQFAQDPRVKTPTMVELASDLSLRYITLDEEQSNTVGEQLADRVELATLASVLFTITGHKEWHTKQQVNLRLANQAKMRMDRESRGAMLREMDEAQARGHAVAAV